MKRRGPSAFQLVLAGCLISEADQTQLLAFEMGPGQNSIDARLASTRKYGVVPGWSACFWRAWAYSLTELARPKVVADHLPSFS